MSLCPRTQTVPRAGRVPAAPPTPASLAKSDVTTGRVPCLNQSNDFASLDLSVLFFILPVNTSASTGPPNCTWWAFVLWCFAMQPCKEQTPDNTKGSPSLSPPPPPPSPPSLFSPWFQSFIMNWACWQRRPCNPLQNFLRYTS